MRYNFFAEQHLIQYLISSGFLDENSIQKVYCLNRLCRYIGKSEHEVRRRAASLIQRWWKAYKAYFNNRRQFVRLLKNAGITVDIERIVAVWDDSLELEKPATITNLPKDKAGEIENFTWIRLKDQKCQKNWALIKWKVMQEIQLKRDINSLCATRAEQILYDFSLKKKIRRT